MFANNGTFFVDNSINGIEFTEDFTQLTLTKGDFTKVGLFGLKYNDAMIGTTLNLPSYPGVFSSQNSTINAGIIKLSY